jgi:hypothetical protein
MSKKAAECTAAAAFFPKKLDMNMINLAMLDLNMIMRNMIIEKYDI